MMKNEKPTAGAPSMTNKACKVWVLIKFDAWVANPIKSKDGPIIIKGYRIDGVLLMCLLNSILAISSFPKLHIIKSIVQSPICAITPNTVKKEAKVFKLFFGNTLLNESSNTAPVKLNQCAKSIGF